MKFARFGKGGTALLLILLVAVGVIPASPQKAEAYSASEFDAGSIISDANFFDGAAMNEQQIQLFLEQRVPGCAGAGGENCLRDYRSSTFSRPAVATNHCGPYAGAPNERASTIIFKVAQACNISPKVLIVTLQKERGLITKTSPTASDYQVAMGYGCPDTAPCATEYYGFYNQVYLAARQFRQYTYRPTSYKYRVGTVNVQFHPNAACGSTPVVVRNQATANLYNYTPYQPNAASLANLDGSGDACSSYGNRNFWNYYYAWFGNPNFSPNAFASLDDAAINYQSRPAAIRLRGWTLDPSNLQGSMQVQIFSTSPDGSTQKYITTADQSRPDIAAAYPGAGSAHGFLYDIPLRAPGPYRTCIYTMRAAGPALYGCQNFLATQSPPFGKVDEMTLALSDSGAQVTVRGWAIDTIAPRLSMPVHIWVTDSSGGQQSYALNANEQRPDVGSVYPNAGASHGYRATIPLLRPGANEVCAYAIGTPAVGDNNVLLGCSTLNYGPSRPAGIVENIATVQQESGPALSVSGWAYDEASMASPTKVRFAITDPSGRTSSLDRNADQNRPDVASVFPAAGANHGFGVTVPLVAQGLYRVCVSASGARVFGEPYRQLECRSASYGPSSPVGYLDSADLSRVDGTITARGWAMDDGMRSTSTNVRISVTRPGGTVDAYDARADTSRPDIATIFSDAGANHGYAVSFPATVPGTYTICVSASPATAFAGAPVRQLPCKSVAVASSPRGMLDSAQSTGDTAQPAIRITGWALDLADPVRGTSVDIVMTAPSGKISTRRLEATTARPDVGAVFSGTGSNHGFEASIAVTERGEHVVCASALGAGTVGQTVSQQLGCKTATVQ